MPNQRLAPYQRHVQRPMLFDQADDSIYQFVAVVVAQTSKGRMRSNPDSSADTPG